MSNYRKIGEFIELVDERNIDLRVTKLLGLSISKEFIPSVANIVGTNMANYKIIRKNQFACSIMQVRRDKKMPVALLKDYEEAIISQAYPVFQIIDEEELLPDYLMMWMSRSEFDREACFLAVGGVRGSLEWEDFLEMELPVPSIKKQHEIVNEYNTIVNRIKLNEQLNQKLEKTAQAIYKHWFVDFEFPNEEGKPYKSSGGKMIWNDELEKEIPEGWKATNITNLIHYNYDNYNNSEDFTEIFYLDTSNIVNNKIECLQKFDLVVDSIPSRAKRKVSHNDIIFSTVRPNLKHYGIIKSPKTNMIVSTAFMVMKLKPMKLCAEHLYLFLTQRDITKFLHSKAEMSVSTYPSIKPEDVLNLKISLPNDERQNILIDFKSSIEVIFNTIEKYELQNDNLCKVRDLLLQRIVMIEFSIN